MRKWKQVDLNEWIRKNKSQVNQNILNSREERMVRRRERDEEERDILTEIVIQKWKNSLGNGLITKIGERRWRIDFNRAGKEKVDTD